MENEKVRHKVLVFNLPQSQTCVHRGNLKISRQLTEVQEPVGFPYILHPTKTESLERHCMLPPLMGPSWTVQPEDMLLLPHSLVCPARGPEVPTCLRAGIQKTCRLESVDRSLLVWDFKSRGDRPVPQMPVVDASETTVQERAYNCQCKAEIPGNQRAECGLEDFVFPSPLMPP